MEKEGKFERYRQGFNKYISDKLWYESLEDLQKIEMRDNYVPTKARTGIVS